MREQINYPKPMDPEARKALQAGVYLDERCFMYGNTCARYVIR